MILRVLRFFIAPTSHDAFSRRILAFNCQCRRNFWDQSSGQNISIQIRQDVDGGDGPSTGSGSPICQPRILWSLGCTKKGLHFDGHLSNEFQILGITAYTVCFTATMEKCYNLSIGPPRLDEDATTA